jgi:hypothetical protein
MTLSPVNGIDKVFALFQEKQKLTQRVKTAGTKLMLDAILIFFGKPKNKKKAQGIFLSSNQHEFAR